VRVFSDPPKSVSELVTYVPSTSLHCHLGPIFVPLRTCLFENFGCFFFEKFGSFRKFGFFGIFLDILEISGFFEKCLFSLHMTHDSVEKSELHKKPCNELNLFQSYMMGPLEFSPGIQEEGTEMVP
jgi:hypothetical protein